MASEAGGEQATLGELQDKTGDSVNSSLSSPDCRKEFMNLKETEDSAKINSDETISVPLLDLNRIEAEQCCVSSTTMYHSIQNDEVKAEISKPVTLGPCACSEGEVLVETPSRVQDPLPDVNNGSYSTGENLKAHVTNRNNEGNVDEGNDNQVETYEEMIAMTSNEAARDHAATVLSIDEHHTGETGEVITNLSEVGNDTLKYEGKVTRNYDGPTCLQLKDENGIEERKIEDVENTSAILVHDRDNYHEEIIDLKPHMVVANVAEIPSVQHKYAENEHEVFSRKDNEMLAKSCEYQDNQETIEVRPSSDEDHNNEENELLMTETSQKEGEKEDSLLNAESYIEPKEDDPNDLITNNPIEKEVTNIEIIGDTIKLQEESTLKDKLLANAEEITKDDTNYTKVEETAELMPEYKSTVSRNMIEQMKVAVPSSEKEKDVCIGDLTVLEKMGSEDSLLTLGNNGDLVPQSINHIKRESGSDNDEKPSKVSTEDYTHNNIGDTATNDDLGDTFNENELDCKESKRHTSLEPNTKPTYEEEDDAKLTGTDMKNSQDMEDSPEEVDKTDSLDEAEGNIDDNTTVIGDHDTCKQKLEINDVHENVIVAEECIAKEDDAIEETHHEGEIKAESSAEVAARMRNEESNSESEMSRSVIDGETFKLMAKDDLERNEKDALVLPIVHDTVGKESANDTTEEKLAVYEENGKLDNQMLDISYGDDKPQVGPTDNETDINTFAVMVDDKYIKENIDDSVDVVGEKHDTPNINEEELVDENSNQNTEFNVHKDKNNKVAVEVQPTNAGYHINEDEEISKSGKEEVSKLLADKDELILSKAHEIINQEYADDPVLVEEKYLILEEKNEELGNTIVDSSDNRDKSQIGQTDTKVADDKNIKENLDDSTDAVGENNDALNINEELMDQNSKDNTESDVNKNEDHKNEVEIATIGSGDKENLDDSTDTVGENNDAPSIIEELMGQNTEDNTKSDVHKNEDHKVEVEITPSGDGDHSSADEEISRSDIDEEKASKLMVEDEMKKIENESLVSAKAQENIAVESAADSALVEEEKEPVYEEKNEDLGNKTVDMSYGDNNNQGGPTDIEISDTTPANTMDDKCTKKSYDDSIDAVGETHETPNINEEERMSQDIQDSIESNVRKDEDHNVEVVIAPTTDGDHINDDEDVSEEKNDGLGNDKVDFSYGDGKTQGPIKDEIITNESTDDSVLVEDEEQQDKNGADNDLVCFSYGGDGKTQVGPTNAEICDTTSLKMDDKSIKESFDDSSDDGEKHEAHNVIEKEQMDQNSKMESDVHKDEVHNVAIETNHGYLINEDEKISRSDIDEEKTSKLIVDDDLEKNENDSLILMKIHEAIAKESEDDSVLANEEEIPTYEEKNEKLGNDVYFSYGDDKPQVGSTEAEICDTTYLKMADDKTIRDNFDDSTDVVGEKHDADNISEEEQMNENRKPNTEFDVHKDEDHYVAVNENDEISRSNNDEENTSKLITEDDLEKNERDSLSYSDDKLQVGQSNTETHDNISAKKVDERNIENFNDSIDAVTEINVASNINEEERMNQNAKENTESEEQKYEDHKVETEVAPTGIGYHNNEDEEISTIDEEGTSKLMTEDDPDKKEKDAFIPEVSEIITKEPELVHAEEEKQSACEEKKEEFDFSYSDKFQVGQSDTKTHNKISTKTVDDNNIEENFNDSIDADDEKNDAPNINEEEMKCQNFKFNIESDLHKDENHEIEAKVALAGSGDYINENEEISAPDIDEEDTSKLMTQDDIEKNQYDAFIVPEVSETITKQSADDLVHTEEAKQSVYQEKNKEFDFSYRDDKLQVEQTVTEMHDTISAKTVDANDSLEAYINEEERMSQNSKDIIESDSYKNEDPKVEADLAPTNIADHISAAEEISVTAVHEEDMSMLTTQDDLEKNENDAYVISEVHETSTKESADDSVYFEEKESVYEEKIEEFDSSHCDDKLQVGQTDSETHDTIAENTVNDSTIEENLNDPIDAVSEKSDAPNINEEETIGQHFKESIESDVHEDVDHKVEADVAPLRIREQIIADEKISMTGIDEEDVSTLMSQDDPEKNENDAFVIQEVHETSTRESADDPVHFEEEKESVYQEKIEEFDSSYCDDKLQVEQENAGIHDTISAKTLDDNNIQENLNDSIDEVSEKSDAPNINQEEMIGQFSKDIIELGVHKDEDHKDEPDVAPASIGDHISATNEEISVTGMVEEDMPTLTTQDDLEKNEDDAFVIPEVHETSTIESADDSVHFEEEKESVYQEKIEEFDSSYCDDKLQVGQTGVETHDTTSAKTVDDNNVEENFDDSIDGVSKKSDAPDVNEEGMIGQISKDIIELDVHKDEDHKIEADVAPASIGHPISVTDKEISMTAMDEEHVPTLTTQEDLEKNVNDAFVIPEVHETITKEFADETLHFQEENESVYEEKIEEFDSSYCDDKLQVGQTGVEIHETVSAKTVDNNNIKENLNDSIDAVSEKSDAPNINEEEIVDQKSKDITGLGDHKDEEDKVEAEVAPARSEVHINADEEMQISGFDIDEEASKLILEDGLEKNDKDAQLLPKGQDMIANEFVDDSSLVKQEKELVDEEKIAESDYKMVDMSYGDDKHQLSKSGVDEAEASKSETKEDVQKNEEEASVLPKVQYIIDKQSADDSVLIEGKEQLVHEKKNQEIGNNAADFSHHDDKLQAGSTHTATSDPIDSKALDDESVKGNLEDSVDTVAEKHNANEEHNHILEIKESDDSHNCSKDTEELVQNTNETHEFERTDCQNMDMLREGSQPQNIGEMSIIEDYDAQINYNLSGDSEIIKKAAGLEESNEEEVRNQIIVSNDIILDAELPLEVMVQENHHETTEDSKFIEECSLGDEQENEEHKGSDQPTKENDLKHVNETFKEAEDNQISQKDVAEQIPDNIAENDNTDKNSDSFSNEVPERIIVAQTCNSAEEHNEDNQEKQEISFQENLAEICLPYQDTLAGTETENAYDTPHTEHQVKETNFSSYRSSEIAESEPREETLPYQETSTSKEDALSTNVDSPENDMKEDVTAVSLEDHIQEAIVNVQHMETNVSDNKSQEDKESGDILVIKEIKHQQEEGITDVISHVKLSKDFFTKEDNKGSGDDEGHSDSSSQNEKSQSVYTSKPSYIDDEGHEQDIERVLKTNTGEEQEENNRANLEMKVERRNTENSTEEELLEGQKPKNPIELVCDKQEQGEGTEIIHATIENSLQTNRNEVLNALNDLDPVKCNNEHTQGSNVLENIFKEEKTLQTEDSNEGNEETQEEKNDDLLVNGKPVEKNIELSNRYIGNLESEKLQKTTNFSECNIWPQEDASGTVASDAIKIKQSAEVSHKPKNIEQEINVEPKETNTMMHETPNDKIGEHGSTSLGENFLITRPIEAIGITSVLEEDQKKNLDDSSTGMKSDVQVKNNEISEFTFGECTQEDIEPNTENLETNAIGMMPEDAKSVDNTKETENLPEEAMRSQFSVDNPIMTEGNLSYLASDELNIDGQIKVPAEYQNMNSSEETSKEEKYFSTDNTVNEAISASVQEEEKKKDNSEEASPEALNLESAETENNQQPNLDDLPVSRFLMEKILRDEDAKVENSHTMECEERVQEDDIGEQHDDNSIIKQDRKINTFSDEEVTKDTGISGDKGNNIVQKSRVLVHGESVEKKTENAMTQDGQTPENNTHDWSPESEGRGGSEIKPFCLQSEMQATSNDHMELASGEQSEEPSKTIDKTFKELDHVQDEKIPDVFLEGMTGSNIQDEIESLDMESNVLPIVNESERDVLLKESTRSFEEDETIEKAPNTVLGEQKAFSDLHGEAKLSDHGGISSDFLSTKSGVFHGEPEILGGTPEIKFTSEIASETAEKEMVDEEETSGIQRQSENSNINEASKVSDLYEVHHFGASEQHTHEHIQVDEMPLQGTTVNMHEKGTSEKEANNKEGIVESQTQYGNRDINQELKAPDEIQQFDVTEKYIKDFIQVEKEGETGFDIYKKGIEEEKEAHQEEAKTDDEKDNKEEDEHEQEHEESIDQPVIMVDARDTDSKSSQKKSHNILSGMGSKVKHSLAKVKKAITGKSSHAKIVSPRQEKPTV